MVEIFFRSEQIEQIQVAEDRMVDPERKSGQPLLEFFVNKRIG